MRTLLRLLLMRFHRSKVPTGIVPLSRIHSVVIYRDPREPVCEREYHRFFDPLGIEVTVISEFDRNIRTGSDLFIATSSFPSVSEKYAAISSTASFKVGRRQLKHRVYDLVVSDVDVEAPVSQTAAFAEICNLLKKIQ